MNNDVQIFPLSEVADRASLSPGVKGIHIYNGFINEHSGKSVLTMYIKRDAGGKWPADQLAYVNKLKGNFTVVLKPSNELFYITSFQNVQSDILQGAAHFATDTNILDLVNKITALEAEKMALINQVQDLQDELKNFETAGDKFSYALENLFFRIAPKLGLMPEPVLNGTENNNSMENWQNINIPSDPERAVETALEVIYTAFGDEFIVNFAKKIQQQPGLVGQLKAMI